MKLKIRLLLISVLLIQVVYSYFNLEKKYYFEMYDEVEKSFSENNDDNVEHDNIPMVIPGEDITDSNSGITQEEGKRLGIRVVPMPFTINGEEYLEDITLNQEQFYEMLLNDAEVSTAQPSVGFINSIWDEMLEEYDQIVYIPMSIPFA